MTNELFTPERRAIVDRMAQIAPAFAKRSIDYDRDASFPWDNWADLKEAGLLGICIPTEAGGLGGDFVAYALASEELGRHCATTGLTFNMHVATSLLVGQIADDMDLPEHERVEQHARCLLYTSPSPRDGLLSRMPSSA